MRTLPALLLALALPAMAGGKARLSGTGPLPAAVREVNGQWQRQP